MLRRNTFNLLFDRRELYDLLHHRFFVIATFFYSYHWSFCMSHNYLTLNPKYRSYSTHEKNNLQEVTINV